MKIKFILSFACLFIFVMGLLMVLPTGASAGDFMQQFMTPTPNEEGKIIYTVQANDTCHSIFYKTALPLEELPAFIDQLRSLNGLDENCTLQVGQALILAVTEVIPPTPTLDAASMPPEEIEPTAPPPKGEGTICVVLFQDDNGDGIRRDEDEEQMLANGAVSINDRLGAVSLTGTTVLVDADGSGYYDPLCFEKIPEGEYNISMGIPAGYNATGAMNYPLNLLAGEYVVINFAVQPAKVVAATETANNPESTSRTPILLIGGILLLLGGGGLAFYIYRTRSQQ